MTIGCGSAIKTNPPPDFIDYAVEAMTVAVWIEYQNVEITDGIWSREIFESWDYQMVVDVVMETIETYAYLEVVSPPELADLHLLVDFASESDVGVFTVTHPYATPGTGWEKRAVTGYGIYGTVSLFRPEPKTGVKREFGGHVPINPVGKVPEPVQKYIEKQIRHLFNDSGFVTAIDEVLFYTRTEL